MGTGVQDAVRRGSALTSARAWASVLPRLVRHRSWAQRRLLTVAGSVALLVAVLVSTLAVLSDATDRYGVPTALAADPERTRISLTLSSPRAGVADVLEATEAALGGALGLPVTSEVNVTSEMYDVDRGSFVPGYAYLDRRDGVDDAATLVEGTWPDASGAATAADPLPVAVPVAGAYAFDLEVGDTWLLSSQDAGSPDLVVRVVGIYDVPDPTATHWSRDRLSARGYDPSFPVPFSMGFLRTEAVGPLVVAPEAAASDVFRVRRIVVRADPDVSGVTAARLPELRAAAAVLEDEVGWRLDEVVGDVAVGSPLAATLRTAATGVVVTRAGTGVATVLLLVVAVAALLQTARLIAEARTAEHDLMRARGASRRQLFAAVAVEAALLGAVVVVLAPPLSGLVARALGGPLAPALPADPRDALRALPWSAWAASGLVAVLLVAVSTVPLLRAPATFVEGQQARGRRARRGSLARLAADVVAVAAAALAWTQLQAYGGPLVGAGSRLAADPVLVVGPALLLLAAVLVGVRVIPLAGALLERAARRGRGLVVPLAGWDVGRRAHHATAAVLLLAIAVSAASFGLTQRATWQRSQVDQADFAVGAPVVVADGGHPGADGTRLAAGGSAPQPVLRERVRVSDRGHDGQSETGFAGDQVDLVAAPGPARAVLDRGRVAREGGRVVAGLQTADPTTGGVDLGEGVLGFSANVRIEGPAAPEVAAVLLRLVLEDGTGVLRTVDLGMHVLASGGRPVDVLLPELRMPVGAEPQASADALARQAAEWALPMRLVGFQAIAVALDPAVRWGDSTPYDVQVTIDDLAVLRPAADVDEVKPEDWAYGVDGDRAGIVRDPLPTPMDSWRYTGSGGSIYEPLTQERDTLWLRMVGLANVLADEPAISAVVAWEPVEEIPTVVTDEVLRTLPRATARGYLVHVADVTLPVVVRGSVERIPTTNDAGAIAADYTTLTRAVVQAGGTGHLVDEWWVDAADPEAYLAALPDAPGRAPADRATTVPGARAALLEHPVGAAVPVVLALLALGGALVAGVGFAVHTAVTVRERDLELAQLRAVGLTRGRLTAAVGLESAILAGLGVALGVAVGVGVATVVGPLLVVGAGGADPVPPVETVVPVQVAWVALGLVGLVAVLTVAVAAAQRTADPAALLRAGEAR